jgi:hypothetical protein
MAKFFDYRYGVNAFQHRCPAKFSKFKFSPCPLVPWHPPDIHLGSPQEDPRWLLRKRPQHNKIILDTNYIKKKINLTYNEPAR